MQTTRLISALAGAALLGTVQSVAPAQTLPSTAPTPAAPTASGAMNGPGAPGMTGPLALDARNLRARRTATGYTLTGQAQVNDACRAARFDPSLLTIFPPQYNLHQFRAPGKMGVLCIQRLTWITAMPRTVTSAKPPAYVTVRTQKGAMRLPIR